ncbi:MAG TPA: hypothetical protein C5S50_04695 [Methanosarcinaceae archaeon]|nr:hypothetical protein [Methanosarcinaceae archaeon]
MGRKYYGRDEMDAVLHRMDTNVRIGVADKVTGKLTGKASNQVSKRIEKSMKQVISGLPVIPPHRVFYG